MEEKKPINLNNSINSGQPRYLIRRGVKTPLRPESKVGKKKTKTVQTGGSKGQPPRVFNMNELNEQAEGIR